MRFNGGNEPWREVVGIIGDVRHWGLDREVNPELYMPHEQEPAATLSFVLQAATSPTMLVPEMARLVRDFDPHLPLGTTRTMDDVAARSVAARRWSAVLLGSFGVLALVLAAVGICGVMAQLVSSRTSEIGIRLALGARPGEVLWQIVGEGLLYAITGLAVGLVVSLAVMRGLNALLFEVGSTDPLTLAAVSVTLLVVAFSACVGPARRAMRIDPVQALRLE
jgi:putative ABC transport system permease protein